MRVPYIGVDLLDKDAVRDTLRRLIDVVNGRINLVDNIYCRILTATFPSTPDEELTLTHNLGKIPTIYIANTSSAAIVYDGADRADWSDSTMTLRCNIADIQTTIVVM